MKLINYYIILILVFVLNGYSKAQSTTNQNVNEGGSSVVKFASSTSPDHTYFWVYEGETLQSTNDYTVYQDSISFHYVKMEHSGEYTRYAIDGNGDTIRIDIAVLNVIACTSFDELLSKIYEVECDESELALADVDLSMLSTVHLPVTMQLVDDLGMEIDGVNQTFSTIPLGNYNLHILDDIGCEAIISNFISVVPMSGCETENVFTPNGDGVADEYFIDHNGEVQIISKSGQILKTLDCPAYWDGMDNSGNLLSGGLYIIYSEGGESYQTVTLLR